MAPPNWEKELEKVQQNLERLATVEQLQKVLDLATQNQREIKDLYEILAGKLKNGSKGLVDRVSAIEDFIGELREERKSQAVEEKKDRQERAKERRVLKNSVIAGVVTFIIIQILVGAMAYITLLPYLKHSLTP